MQEGYDGLTRGDSLFFRIKHANVIGLHDFYETRTHYYLVMEL